MQSIRVKVKNCMILSAKAQPNGHGSSVVHTDPESGVVFRIDRVEFLCSAALLGWFDETNRMSVRRFLTESQNTLLQSIMQFRMQAGVYAGGSFDDFSFLSCVQDWYDVVNRHNQHVTKRLFFHARLDMEADQVPGQQHLQLQPSQAPHPALPAPIQQQQREQPRTLADGSEGVRADRKPTADDGHDSRIGTAGAGDIAAPSDG